MIKPQDIVEAARSFRHTPYKHQGRTPAKELDCIGVVILAGKIAGVLPHDFDFTQYSRTPDGSLERELDKHCIELPGLTVGAIALFRISAIPHHCGIITKTKEGNWGLLHAYENTNKVREHELINWWQSKMVKVYGFKQVSYHL